MDCANWIDGLIIGWVWMDGLGWKSLCGATLEHRFAMLKMVPNISFNIIMIKGPMNRRCGWALESAEAEVNNTTSFALSSLTKKCK